MEEENKRVENEWCEPLTRCAEGLYVLEEESKKVVWASSYLIEGLAQACVGETCWKAFLGRDSKCPFCPLITEDDGVYVWDYYDPRSRHWVKIKQLLLRRDGKLYRAGNINTIDDVMRLNYETVQEIVVLKNVLLESQGEMTFLTKEATYDALTGLFNRNCFQLDLEREYTDVAGRVCSISTSTT